MNTTESDWRNRSRGDTPENSVPAALEDSAHYVVSTVRVDFSTESPTSAFFYPTGDARLDNPAIAKYLITADGVFYPILSVDSCNHLPLHFHLEIKRQNP